MVDDKACPRLQSDVGLGALVFIPRLGVLPVAALNPCLLKMALASSVHLSLGFSLTLYPDVS